MTHFARFTLIRRHLHQSTALCLAKSGLRPAGRRHSGAQIEVLGLYRAWLREIKSKPNKEWHKGMQLHVRKEFEKHASIRPIEIEKIEALLRRGRQQLKTFKHSNGFKI